MSGPTGVVFKMLRAGGKGCLESLRIFNEVLFENKLPDKFNVELNGSSLQGKGDPLNTNSYRGIKLLEHAFKMYKRILDRRLRETVAIAKMFYAS